MNLNTHTPRRRKRAVLTIAACATALALPTTAIADNGGIGAGGDTGGGGGGGGNTVSGDKAKLKPSGKAIAPASAPARVKKAIEAGNRIDKYPYRLGGGHGSFNDNGYDCSGAVSYVLGPKGAGLIKSPMVSGDFARWGKGGKGKWITTYGNSGHVFVVIAGLRFDTSQPDDGRSGPGWSKSVSKGYANVSRNAAQHKRSL